MSHKTQKHRKELTGFDIKHRGIADEKLREEIK